MSVRPGYDRREFLKRSALTLGGVALSATSLSALAGCAKQAAPAGGATPKAPLLVNAIRTLTNEYHAAWDKGARMFAESIGATDRFIPVLFEGNSQKQMEGIKAAIARGEPMVLNIDPNDSPDMTAVARMCEEAKVYYISQWNKPNDMHPWDFKYWVAHLAGDGFYAGYTSATVLFDAMGKKGGVVGLQGILDNVPAKDRWAGLEKALSEYPDIKLLDGQTAQWDRNQALSIMQTWMTKYGDEIQGVWAANDNMGLGALEALRGKQLAGKVPVSGVDGTSEAIQAVAAGEFAVTIADDPAYKGGYGLALPYHALKGTFDHTKEPKEHREFYISYNVVTKDNASDAMNKAKNPGPYDFNDLWARAAGQIVYR